MANGSNASAKANLVTRGFRWTASVARRTYCCTHFQTVTRDTPINLHCPGVPRGPDRQAGKAEGEKVFTGTGFAIVYGSDGPIV